MRGGGGALNMKLPWLMSVKTLVVARLYIIAETDVYFVPCIEV